MMTSRRSNGGAAEAASYENPCATRFDAMAAVRVGDLGIVGRHVLDEILPVVLRLIHHVRTQDGDAE